MSGGRRFERADELREELVSALRGFIHAIEDGYQWMSLRETQLHPEETVASLVFACNGDSRIFDLTWNEIRRIRRVNTLLRDVETRRTADLYGHATRLSSS